MGRADHPVPPGRDADSIVLAFPVPNEFDGQRLDRFVQWRIPRLTRERAAEIILACAARADGSHRDPSDRVRAGETVLLVRERFVEPEAPRDYGILYSDAVMTVVDKPAGLPIHPSATYHRNTLTSLMRERFGPGGPHICHRLDRETSGVVVCAIPGPDEVKLKRQFATRGVDKQYLAIVRGTVEADEGVIDASLRRATGGVHLAMEAHPDGMPARTTFRVIARKDDRTLVHLFPETGRQHQLRVHLASIGHPIVGDKLYGPEGQSTFVEHVDTGMTDALLARLGHVRQALHAYAVSLDHPRTGERMTFRAPLAPDLVAVWGEVPSLP